MKPIAIHQFHSGSAYGDAVTNGLIFTQKLLRELGFESEIYVEHIAEELIDKIKHYKQYKGSPEQILLIHHSMGHDLANWILDLPDLKVMVYHNITPASFFPKNSLAYKYSLIGREQLKILKPQIAAAICDSPYNAEELKSLGYSNISVIPLLIDVENIINNPVNHSLIDLNSGIFTILFVGRISPNKCQHDIIEVFKYFIEIVDQPAQLVLVGGYNSHENYYQFLQELISTYGLTDAVKIVGKVPNEDLYAWYHAADVFISMSEHEGFGVPLIESMIFNVPVVAYKSSNVPYTLGEGGILFNQKKNQEIAALINLIRKDKVFCRTILKSQRRRLADFSRYRLISDLTRVLREVGADVPEPKNGLQKTVKHLQFQIEGPFETNYSLAIVNRELAFALEKECPDRVALFATEGPGDYQPNISAIEQIEKLDLLWKRSKKRSMANVVIRNLYPPRVADMDGLINLLYFAWEESNLPEEWVNSFNYSLDGFTVISSFVKKVLVDAGVYAPIHVAGCGIEQVLREQRQTYPGYIGKSFRFLHISSCFPRKGVDVLLQAYVNAFKFTDNVSLIIKTFPNPHNNVQEQINYLKEKYQNIPEIILINEDIPVGCIVDLYHRCHALVAPSRGEGFGLPMAEAMLFGLPVITTGFGGQTDFCTDETSWLINFHFAAAKSHLSKFNSVWVEPDVTHLAYLMREIYESPKEKHQTKLRAAKELIQQKFTWERCASRVQKLVSKIDLRKPLLTNKRKLGWVTTWNSKCGIAAYSSYLNNSCLSKNFDIKILASRKDSLTRVDDSNVIRCWDDLFHPDLNDLESAIDRESLDIVVIQFNFGFFELTSFSNLLVKLSERGVTTVVMFHSTKDVIKPDFQVSLREISAQLALADRLLVHTISDLNRLKDFGLVKNVSLFPHGVKFRTSGNPKELKQKLSLLNKKIIASYGFLLPNKGIEQLIEAFYKIHLFYPDTTLLLVNSLYPNPVSYELQEKCKVLISNLELSQNIIIINEFLEDNESFMLLECADIIIFPYQNSNESSSAAVRFGLASNRPVVCTPLEIFEDVKEIVHFLPGIQPDDIANGIINLLNNSEFLNSKSNLQQQWLKEHSWDTIAKQLNGMLHALVNEKI